MKKILYTYALIFFLFSCKNNEMSAEKVIDGNAENLISLSEAQLKNAKISTTTLAEKEISSALKLNGKIDVPPQNLVSVSVPLGGYLKNTQLLPGMHIKKGDVIAILEDQQYIQLQQDYLLAKSKLHLAELEYNRQKELNKAQASSDKITQQAAAEASIQNINKNALAEKLKLININPNQLSANIISKSIKIYSPISGFVSKVNFNIGKYINASDVLFELINPNDIHLNLKVFEKDIPNLSIGQKVLAYTNTKPNTKHICEIILISQDITENGYAEIHCHFKKYDKTILPGMYMNAEIEIKSSLVMSLPEDAIVTYEGLEYVFVKKEPLIFEMVPVVLGAKENGFVAIKNHEKLINKSVVATGAYTLLMKLKNKEE
jgi:cobalt-zinc-cadmium efflux system membrane fusion protein